MEKRKKYSYIKHSKKIFSKKNIFPEYVTLFVTTRCNFACSHCFYWKHLNTEKNELTLGEIGKIAKSMDEFNLLILTGGEPYLRRDLSDIVQVFYETNNIQNLIIPSNGYLTDKIIEVTEKILKSCPDLHVLVEVSIDDIGKKHDRIRKVNNAFVNAIKTIEKLRLLKRHYGNLSIGTICVFSQLNQNHFGDIYDYIKDKIRPDSITVALIRGCPKKNVKNIDIAKYEEVTKWINRDFLSKRLGFKFKYSNVSKANTIVMRNLIAKTYKENKNQIICQAGTIAATIYPNGDVFPCEILDKKLGNLRNVDYDFGRIWFSENTKEITKWIKDTKCFCTHECNMTANILFNAKQWVTKLLVQMIKVTSSPS